MRISDWEFRRVLFRSGVIDQDELAAKFFLGVADKRRNWNLEVPPTDFHECAETLLPVDDPTGCAFADIYREFSGPGLGLLDRGPAHESKHDRSEEHTSELQSLMRISYAVFCLKKK